MKKKSTVKVEKKPDRQSKVEVSELSFSVHDFTQYERDHFWYIGIALLALSGLVWAVWARDWLLCLTAVALAVAFFRLASTTPHACEVTISDRGVTWGDRFLPYHHLKAFWLAEIGGRVNLYLEGINFTGEIRVIVPVSQVKEVFAILSQYLPWHPHRKTPLSDRLSHWLRF